MAITVKEVLMRSQTGVLPKVRAKVDVRKDVKAGEVGQVVVVKQYTTNSGYLGIAVSFTKNFDVWFHESDETDKRTAYMRDLEFIY